MTAVAVSVGAVPVLLVGAEDARAAVLDALEPTTSAEPSSAEVTVVVTLDDEEAALAETRERRAAGAQHTVLVGPRDVVTPRRALDAGAQGVVFLERVAETLAPTLAAVVAGQVAIPAAAGAQLARPMLTVREKQTLAMVVLGFSNGEIARKLFLTESTVKSHLGSSFRKLNVSSRKEAVARILDPEGGLGTGILSITGGDLLGPSADEPASA